MARLSDFTFDVDPNPVVTDLDARVSYVIDSDEPFPYEIALEAHKASRIRGFVPARAAQPIGDGADQDR